MKEITILLPVYNDEKYLKYCLDSIVSQSYTNFKCLIGFNGTMDRSREIAEEIVSGDSRFFIYDYGDDKGKAITLNKLIKESDTDYICLIDGDDFWHSEKLEKQAALIGKYDVIGTLTHYINSDNEVTGLLRLAEDSDSIRNGFSVLHNQIVNSSCLIKKKDVLSCGGWDPDLESLEDFDLWIRLHKSGKTFYNIQEFLVYHRIHTGSNFNASKGQGTIVRNKLIEKHS